MAKRSKRLGKCDNMEQSAWVLGHVFGPFFLSFPWIYTIFITWPGQAPFFIHAIDGPLSPWIGLLGCLQLRVPRLIAPQDVNEEGGVEDDHVGVVGQLLHARLDDALCELHGTFVE